MISLLPEAEREVWFHRQWPEVIKTFDSRGSTSDFGSSSYMVHAGTAFATLTLILGLKHPVAVEEARVSEEERGRRGAMTVSDWIDRLLAERFEAPALEWLGKARAEIAAGVAGVRFAGLISAASRHARRRPAEPEASAIEEAGRLVEGWNPERWSLLDALRAALVLARSDLDQPSVPAALLGAFAFADVGELCALYRTLPLLPRQEDYLWQAGEGCRSNMTEVFEAVACDSPYAARHFDEIAWRALVIKAIFIDAPLWRVWGLDGRLSEELARMALDLADERRSAGRPVQPQLWLCPGPCGGARAIESMERELAEGPPEGRAAAAYGLARAGHLGPVAERLNAESDPAVVDHFQHALGGNTRSSVFRAFESTPC